MTTILPQAPAAYSQSRTQDALFAIQRELERLFADGNTYIGRGSDVIDVPRPSGALEIGRNANFPAIGLGTDPDIDTGTDLLRVADSTGTVFTVESNGITNHYRGAKERMPALSGTTPTINFFSSSHAIHTLTGNTTYTFSSADRMRFRLFVNPTGAAYTVTWPTVTWAIGASAPTLSTSGFNVIDFYNKSGTVYGVPLVTA